jgi:hypothetical protein
MSKKSLKTTRKRTQKSTSMSVKAPTVKQNTNIYNNPTPKVKPMLKSKAVILNENKNINNKFIIDQIKNKNQLLIKPPPPITTLRQKSLQQHDLLKEKCKAFIPTIPQKSNTISNGSALVANPNITLLRKISPITKQQTASPPPRIASVQSLAKPIEPLKPTVDLEVMNYKSFDRPKFNGFFQYYTQQQQPAVKGSELNYSNYIENIKASKNVQTRQNKIEVIDLTIDDCGEQSDKPTQIDLKLLFKQKLRN